MHPVLPALRRTSADAAQYAAAIHAPGMNDGKSALMVHLARVAACVQRLVEGCPFWTSDHRDDAVQVAWLHRALLDGQKTARDLRRECFSKIVIDDVEALTQNYAAHRGEWNEDAARNSHLAAVLVMLADRKVNYNSEKNEDKKGKSDVETERQANISMMLIDIARLKGWSGDPNLVFLEQ